MADVGQGGRGRASRIVMGEIRPRGDKLAVTSRTLYRHSTDVLTAQVDDDLVMMSIQAGNYYGIGGIGTLVWRLLADPRSIDELVDVVVADYDVEREQCASDLVSFVEELVELNLVEST